MPAARSWTFNGVMVTWSAEEFKWAHASGRLPVLAGTDKGPAATPGFWQRTHQYVVVWAPGFVHYNGPLAGP